MKEYQKYIEHEKHLRLFYLRSDPTILVNCKGGRVFNYVMAI